MNGLEESMIKLQLFKSLYTYHYSSTFAGTMCNNMASEKMKNRFNSQLPGEMDNSAQTILHF